MSAPILGIGEAFRGFVDSERQRRDLRDAAAGAAQMFRQIGTPEAGQYAELFLSNPRAAFLMAKQAGGIKSLYAIAQEQAARGKIAKATEGLEGGSPEQLSALAGLAAQEGEFGSAAQLYDLARPGPEAKPIIREFKIGDRIVTKQFEPTSGRWVDLEEAPRFSGKGGLNVTLPDGTVISQGGLPGTTATQTNIEKQLSDARGLQARLSAVRAAYQPKFQTLPFRAAQTLSSWGEKLGRDPTPEERQALQEFAEFRGISVDMISQYLHQLSGAAITPQEYKRLTESLPNAGYGLFDGDAPSVFDAKLRSADRQSKLALLRLDYERKHGLGLGLSGFSLLDRKGILKATAKDIEAGLIAQGESPQRARDVAAQRIAEINKSLGE